MIHPRNLLAGFALSILLVAPAWAIGGFGPNGGSGSGGTSFTFPAANAVVVVNGAGNNFAGVAEVDGSCLLGAGGVWTAGSCGGAGGGVPSIAGTANQINQSGSPGATTLSLSSTIVLPGTINGNTIPSASDTVVLLNAIQTLTNKSIAWGQITGTPTTRAGYGITDALTNVLTSGNVFIGSVGNVATSVALSGDCTLAAAGTITCTKTNNVAFAASATTDTTSATNISSGTLGCGRLPALTGDITSSSCATTLATVNVNTGACGDSTHVCQVTLNGKGLATAASAVAISGGGGSNGLAPFYQSGNWYWAIPAPSASAGGAAVNGVIRWEPIYISGTPTISDMGGRIGTAGSTNCQFALYASSGSTGYSTGSALASTNSFANTSAAVTTAAFTVAYAIPSPGWYWAGVNCNDNTVVWMTFGGSSTPGYNGYAMGSTSAGNLSAGINQTSVAYSTTQAFGTWPTMAGSVTHTGGGVTWLPMFKVQ